LNVMDSSAISVVLKADFRDTTNVIDMIWKVALLRTLKLFAGDATRMSIAERSVREGTGEIVI
jgi:hypothetical protein